MFAWLKSLLSSPQPAGPPQTLRAFRTTDATLSKDLAGAGADGWRFESGGKQVLRLFEVAEPGVEQCILAYHAKLKTGGLEGRAYLEMWCRFPGKGEFFSKGFHHAVSGTTDWADCEAPFFLKRGQKPDLVKLNLAVEGKGTVWIKDVELLQTPLKG